MPTLGLLMGHLPQARTTRLLEDLVRRSAPQDWTVTVLDYHSLPLHSPYTDARTPRAGARWKKQVAKLDGLVIVTPNHERSVPGALKNALDWAASDPSVLGGMPIAIAGAAAPREGRFVTLQHLRSVLQDHGAAVMGQPERTLEVSPAYFGTSGLCVHGALEANVADLLNAAAGFTGFTRRLPARPATPVPRRRVHGVRDTHDPAPSVVTSPTIAAAVARISAADRTTDAMDPVEAVRAAQKAGPGPRSPELGVPRPFLTAVATVDPLVETGDPLAFAVASETSTGLSA